ncbi:MAG: DUF3473 domain-containing protein [Cellvibrionaceae bacterium]
MPSNTLPSPHALTIDVEDYYHVSALASAITPNDWDKWPSRVVNNTQRLLELFQKHAVKGTFFILGSVAEKQPQLIRDIAEAGHEVASHGYSHQLVYKQTPEVFREETRQSKEIIEDLSGQAVTGYRAASYSITRQSLWALDILGELGFKWDSSIFPVYHDRYGIPDSPKSPYNIQTSQGHTLTEYPLTSAALGNYHLPIAGGGYFRLFPYPLFKWLFSRASRQSSSPCMFYLHPWEIDDEQPRVSGISQLSKFRHYNNLDKCEQRLEKMLEDFPFSTVKNSLPANTNSLPYFQF